MADPTREDVLRIMAIAINETICKSETMAEVAAAALSALAARGLDPVELVKTLRWYANEDNYNDDGAPFTLLTSPIWSECDYEDEERDMGQKARATLAKWEDRT